MSDRKSESKCIFKTIDIKTNINLSPLYSRLIPNMQASNLPTTLTVKHQQRECRNDVN